MKTSPAHKYHDGLRGDKKRRGMRREERATSMIDDRKQERRRADVDSPKLEEHGLLKIKCGVCRLWKR